VRVRATRRATRYDSDMRASSVTECVLGAFLGAVSLFAAACGNSSAPSPFVPDASVALDASDAADARDAAAPGEGSVPPPADGSAGRPGEWDGPCVDDHSCDDGADCTTDTCDPVLKRCHFAPSDSACDDGSYCNGAEQCLPVIGCRPGEPVACSDDTACT